MVDPDTVETATSATPGSAGATAALAEPALAGPALAVTGRAGPPRRAAEAAGAGLLRLRPTGGESGGGQVGPSHRDRWGRGLETGQGRPGERASGRGPEGGTLGHQHRLGPVALGRQGRYLGPSGPHRRGRRRSDHGDAHRHLDGIVEWFVEGVADVMAERRARGPGVVVIELVGLGSLVEAILDHLEGKEVLTLLPQHPAQPLHVGLVELPVPRRGALGIDQSLAFEETDLGDGDVGELLAEQGEDVTDGQIGPTAHGRSSGGSHRGPDPHGGQGDRHSSTAAR